MSALMLIGLANVAMLVLMLSLLWDFWRMRMSTARLLSNAKNHLEDTNSNLKRSQEHLAEVQEIHKKAEYIREILQ